MAGIEPAGSDDLPAGEEVDTLGTVSVRVAEQAVLPTTEAVVGHGDWNRDVDPDHTNLDLVLEATCCATVIGEDRGAIPECTRIHQVECFVVGVHPHDREHRAEDFVCVDAHVGGDVVDQGRAEPESALTTVRLHLPAIDDECRAGGLTGVDVGGDLVAVGLGHQRPMSEFFVPSPVFRVRVRSAILPTSSSAMSRRRPVPRSPCSARRPSRIRR